MDFVWLKVLRNSCTVPYLEDLLAQVECDVIRVAMLRLIRRHSLNWFPELFTNVIMFCILYFTIAGVIILSVQEISTT